MDPLSNSDEERLAAILARATSIASGQPDPVPASPPRSRRKGLVAGLVIAGVAATGAGFMFARGGSDGEPQGGASATTPATLTPATTAAVRPSTTVAVTEATDVTEATEPAPTVVAAVTTASASAASTTVARPPSTTSTVPTTASASTSPATATTATTIAATAPTILRGEPSERLPGGQTWPYGLYQDDIMYMRGVVPSEAVSKDIQRRAEAILGAANVRNELQVDPSVPKVETVVVRLGNSVLFKRGDFDIPPESEPGFILWAAFLQSNPEVTMIVIGHADAQGTPESNLALAQQRAEVAMDRIVRNGIDPSRVRAVSHGEDDPLATNDTPEGRSLNRRVEFAVTGLFT